MKKILSEEPEFYFTWSKDASPSDTNEVPYEELEKGIELSLKNAARLASDAELLFSKKRAASAVVLFETAWEELGKAVLLLKCWKSHQGVKDGSWRTIFRSHAAKQTACFDNSDLLWSGGSYGDHAGMTELLKTVKHSLKETRVLGLYVDWMGKQKGWFCPSNESAALEVYYLRYSVDSFLDAVAKRIGEIIASRKTQNR